MRGRDRRQLALHRAHLQRVVHARVARRAVEGSTPRSTSRRSRACQARRAAAAAGGAIVSSRAEEERRARGRDARARAPRAGARERARAPRLVVAGGHGSRVVENVEHLAGLEALVAARGLGDVVEFKPSIADAERVELLSSALCVLYTPDNEHFGIVPIEAMYVGTPVVAVASGGPLETVKHGETGYLVEGTPAAFGDAVLELARDAAQRERMGRAARAHVREHFSDAAFAATLDKLCWPRARRVVYGPTRRGRATSNTSRSGASS